MRITIDRCRQGCTHTHICILSYTHKHAQTNTPQTEGREGKIMAGIEFEMHSLLRRVISDGNMGESCHKDKWNAHTSIIF